MNLSVRWLNSYLSKQIDVRSLADALEQAGIEVEQIKYSINLDDSIVTAKVKKIIQHSNANRLKLADVVVNGSIKRVVCGAPNLEEGQVVAFAQVGTTLPDGTHIQSATIRGEVSEGMLCSARELGISEEHEGIWVFEEKTSVGVPVKQLLSDDAILEVKTSANRSDLQSVIGLAREAAAILGLKLMVPESADLNAARGLSVLAEAGTDRYMLIEVSLAKHSQVAPEMVNRLQAAGVRSISPVVDITNYVMLEWGQPLHAFDAAKVKLPITVRHAKKGEHLTTLDGVKRALTVQDLVIADQDGPIALAGLMGGLETEVTAKTTKILLESATFHPAAVRKMAVRHGLRSEGSARFERGLPVQLVPIAAARAVAYLQEIGATEVDVLADELLVWPWVQHVGIQESRISKLYGQPLPAKRIIKHLLGLGFEAEEFDIVSEAEKHLGKPYIWGASFKKNGTAAFDCGYLIDYLYSQIGQMVGHSAPQIMKSGQEVPLHELRPGDTLYRDGVWRQLRREDRDGVSHVAMYIGDGQIIHAENYHLVDGEWQELPEDKKGVMLDPLEVITEAPGFYGARRHVDDLSGWISVTSPWWRPDISTPEDILEEIARLEGYNNLPATLPAWQPSKLTFDTRWNNIWKLKAALKASGLFEVMTYSFVSAAQLERFGLASKTHLKVKNPISSEQAYLRSELLPSLATTLGHNTGYAKQVGLFEVSKIFQAHKNQADLPEEINHLGVIYQTQDSAYRSVKSILETIEQTFNVAVSVQPVKDSRYYPNRVGKITLNGVEVGRIGELHPELMRWLKIQGSVGYLELEVDTIFAGIKPVQARMPGKFPAIRRDIALLVPSSLPWSRVEEVINESGLAAPQFLSDYYGNELPEKQKSLAVRLDMVAEERTLTEADADQRLAAILQALSSQLGARLKD